MGGYQKHVERHVVLDNGVRRATHLKLEGWEALIQEFVS